MEQELNAVAKEGNAAKLRDVLRQHPESAKGADLVGVSLPRARALVHVRVFLRVSVWLRFAHRGQIR